MDSLFLYYFIFLFFFIFLQSTHAAFKRAKLATATASAEQKANTASPAARRASATKRARRKIPLKLLSSGGGGTSFHKLHMKVCMPRCNFSPYLMTGFITYLILNL